MWLSGLTPRRRLAKGDAFIKEVIRRGLLKDVAEIYPLCETDGEQCFKTPAVSEGMY